MKQKVAILVIMVVLQAGDLLSSRLAFAHGAAELNPLVNALGLWEAKLLVLCVLGLMLICTTRLRGLWTVVVIYGYVVGWNLFLVAKTR